MHTSVGSIAIYILCIATLLLSLSVPLLIILCHYNSCIGLPRCTSHAVRVTWVYFVGFSIQNLQLEMIMEHSRSLDLTCMYKQHRDLS